MIGRKFYRLNQYIQAQQIRVVDEKGKQVGVMPTGEALQKARSLGVDLIEVVPEAKPPVCRLIDFKKFLFLENKKRAAGKKKSKRVKIKEVQLTPFIAENDFRVRINRAEKFLKNGDKVRIAVRFRGREMDKKDFGYRLIQKALENLKSIAQTDFTPKFNGNRLETILTPKRSK